MRVGAQIIADVRGRGAMLAVEFADAGTLTPRADLAKKVAAACHAAGLLVLVCGTFSNVVRLLPPLVIENELLIDGLSVLRDAIQRANDLIASEQSAVVAA